MINQLGKKAGGSESSEKRGLLMSSGFITGEALIGHPCGCSLFSFQGIKTGGRNFLWFLNFLDLLLFLL